MRVGMKLVTLDAVALRGSGGNRGEVANVDMLVTYLYFSLSLSLSLSLCKSCSKNRAACLATVPAVLPDNFAAKNEKGKKIKYKLKFFCDFIDVFAVF
jgi:hypothetical protein